LALSPGLWVTGNAIWLCWYPLCYRTNKVFQRRNWQQSPRKAHLGLFALFWFLIVLGFFTIAATKYFSYTLPFMPAAAILVALWWSDQIVQGQIFHQRTHLTLTSLLSIAFLWYLQRPVS
jgi:4-amino-4-deoxy-L-arabinose transferase-like glycosyltransferase